MKQLIKILMTVVIVFMFTQSAIGQDMNTATGESSLFSNTSGTRNTATGNSSLFANTSGRRNTATGSASLTFNTSGSFNTATGESSLSYNTSGSFNTATGSNSLSTNTSGEFNTATGFFSLSANTSGSRNTATGESSLNFNKGGSGNIAMGSSSLYDNTEGSRNTAIGSSSLYSNTEGSGNTAIGFYAGHQSKGSDNVFIGNFAGYHEQGSNKLYIDNSDTLTPLIFGDFETNVLMVNGSFNVTEIIRNDSFSAGLGHVIIEDNVDFWFKGDAAVEATIDAKIDGTVVFGGEDGSLLTAADIATGYYSEFSVWVEGGIVTEDIAVAASADWNTPDYVFEASYKLPTLKEVENYIKENGHLEDVPSKAEVIEKGWSLPKMDQTLLKKVEELTLYTIEQEKNINEQNKKIDTLAKQVEMLLKIVNK
jgi:hypothetical protein